MARKAGDGIQFTIEGLPHLTKQLNALAPKLRKKALARATRDCAKVVAATAKRLAPKDTGALAKSIKVRAKAKVGRKGRRNRLDVGHSVRTGEGFFKGDQFYGGFLEFGTKPRTAGTKSGDRVNRGRIKAREYLQKAAAQSRTQAMAIFKREIIQGVHEIAQFGALQKRKVTRV